MCFSSPSPPPPAPPPPPPRVDQKEVQAEALKERRRRMLQSGYQSTILTSGAGSEDEATVKKTTLGAGSS